MPKARGSGSDVGREPHHAHSKLVPFGLGLRERDRLFARPWVFFARPGRKCCSVIFSIWSSLGGGNFSSTTDDVRLGARSDAVAGAAAPEDEDAAEGSGLASPKPASAASATRDWSKARQRESETKLIGKNDRGTGSIALSLPAEFALVA